MHSYLITAGSAAQRTAKAHELISSKLGTAKIIDDVDVFILDRAEKNSLGIEKIRELIGWIKLKPFRHSAKAVLIDGAQRLSLEAQNALLKTLEEPPAKSYLFLTTPHPNLLLPTIVSRCATISLETNLTARDDSPFYQEQAANFIKILAEGYGGRLDFTEKNKDLFSRKENALALMDVWLEVLYQKKNLGDDLSKLLNLKKEITNYNLSPRNLLELFLLKLPANLLDSPSQNR